jgi:hypothetical protein
MWRARKELHRARASIAGQAVSSSRGAVPLPSGAPEGHGFQSQRSFPTLVPTLVKGGTPNS